MQVDIPGSAGQRMAGLSVGVTAGRQDGELVGVLARLGAAVLWAPTALHAAEPAGPGVGPGAATEGWRPVAELVAALCAGELDAVAFTSPAEVDGLFAAVRGPGAEAALLAALAGGVLVAAIGPPTAEAVERRGVAVGVCPLQARTGALASALAAAPIGFRSFGGARPLLLDHGRQTVTGPGGVVGLSDLQFALLASLARRPGVTCPTGVLLREVWGEAAAPGPAARRRLEVLASRLRARLETADVHLATVPKRGYRLELAVAAAASPAR